mmetsp:Transcript_28957/g.45401  ORF Transcript_28957/g.45401 Transcript_28957/m.45401 type:complete len:86 (+) Transcript_28957:357-614(+)
MLTGDCTQTRVQWPIYDCSFRVNAFEALLASGSPGGQITPKHMFHHMVARSKECPPALMALTPVHGALVHHCSSPGDGNHRRGIR